MKLKQPPSLLKAAPNKLAFADAGTGEAGRDRKRYALKPWRKWYATRRWKRLRIETFERDGFQCQMCEQIDGNTSRLVCDHIKAHRGNEALFWDPENLQTLCKPCHDGDKQKKEATEL